MQRLVLLLGLLLAIWSASAQNQLCGSFTCTNGGVCGVYGTSCKCQPSWKGKDCSIPAGPISNCGVSNSVLTINGTCQCTDGWTGINCDTCPWGTGCIAAQGINPKCLQCSVQPAVILTNFTVNAPNLWQWHNNVCSSSSTSGVCACNQGAPPTHQATGTYCENYYPCGGFLQGSWNGTKCICKPGFWGPTCSFLTPSTGACAQWVSAGTLYSDYRGSCLMPQTSYYNGYMEVCSDQTWGPLAPVPGDDIGDLSYYPARNFSSWYGVQPLGCTCAVSNAPGTHLAGDYFGAYCLGILNGDPCLNGGSNTPNGCNCVTGYKGYLCEQIDVCDADHWGPNCEYLRIITPPNSCSRTGVAYQDGRYCICFPGYTGITCSYIDAFSSYNYASGSSTNMYYGATTTYDNNHYRVPFIQFPRFDGYKPYDYVTLSAAYQGSGIDAIAYYTTTLQEPSLVYCPTDGTGTHWGPGCRAPQYEDCSNGGLSIVGGCNCTSGWTGLMCIKPSGCVQNNTAYYNGVSCICKAGYHGTSCEFLPCNSVGGTSCGNGTCNDDGSCNCYANYTGIHCNVYCDPVGTYNMTSDSCNCKNHYSGSDCSINECLVAGSGVCNGHGNCTDDKACKCNPNYSGNECNIYCDPIGTYNITSNGCICKAHFHGSDCSTTECGSGNTCSGHGTCNVNGTCTCNQFWSGAVCDTSVGCSDTGGLYYNYTTNQCVCKPGYIPPYCCSFADGDMSRGPCDFGGVRRCASGTTWNGKLTIGPGFYDSLCMQQISANSANMVSADDTNYRTNCNSGLPCPAPLSYQCQMGYSGSSADRCCPIGYTYNSNTCVLIP